MINCHAGGLRIQLWRNDTVKIYLWPALFFAAITLVIFRNYLTGAFFVGTDGMGPPTDLSVMLLENSFFSAWRDMPALGHVDFPSPILSSIYYILMVIIGMSPDDVFRLFMIFCFWLAGFAMYLCAYRITGDKIASLAASIIYLFSQIFLSQVTESHSLFISGYAVFPLLFLCLYLTITERKKIYAVLLPVLSFILGTVGAPHTILITAIFLLLFIFTYSFIIALRKQYTTALSTFLIGLASVAVIVLPMTLSKFADGGMFTLSIAYTIEDTGIFSSYSLFHSFILHSSEDTFVISIGNSWTWIKELWPLGYATSVAVPLAVLYSLKVKSNRRLIVSLAVPAIIFLFVACGPHFPFGFIFEYLFSNVPLMDSIRVYSRFHLLTGFAHALMIGLLLTHIDEVRKMPTRLTGIWKRVRKGLLHKKTLAVILCVCTVFSSSIVLSGEIRTFDLPSSYSQPYEDLSNVDGDFRILNLPYAQVYYDRDKIRFDGYPVTTTPDVGMYSPYISGKMYAFGLETKDYWSFVGSALFGEKFGYKNISQLLGGTADVRFIVSQQHTSANEKDIIASLEGIIVWSDYGNAVIFENEAWEGRVHAANSSMMVVGSRQYLIGLAGMGVADLSDVNVMLSYGNEELDSIRNIAFSSILDYTIETSFDTIKLSPLGDEHTTDSSKWIYYDSYYMDGYSPYPGVYTSGNGKLSFTVHASTNGDYSLLLDLMQTPHAGTLVVEVDGREVANIDCRSTYIHSAWNEISLYLTEGNHTVSLALKGPGNVCAIQASLILSSDLEEAMNSASLENMNTSVVIPAYLSSMWQGTYLPWHGENGFGLGDTAVYVISQDGNKVVLNNGSYTMGKIPLAAVGTEYFISLDLQSDKNVAVVVEIWVDGSPAPDQVMTFSDMQDINFTYTSSGNPFSVVVRSVNQDNIILNSMTVSIDAADASTTLYAPSSGEYLLRIAGTATVYLDGEEIALVSNGIYLEANVTLSKGEHELLLTNANIYGAALIQNEESNSNPIISYVHNNNTSYEITVSSENDFWLMVCDTYSPKWVASIEGEELIHTSANSMVNAYYVPAGEHTIHIEYKGQDTYNDMLIIYAVSVVAGIAVTLALVWFMDRRQRL